VLRGTRPEAAFFVRGDRMTITRPDSGRLTGPVGIALVRPAEFVMFRFGLADVMQRHQYVRKLLHD
jgi:hypothetical protein